jgi:hypothetical protein
MHCHITALVWAFIAAFVNFNQEHRMLQRIADEFPSKRRKL